jgi:hypothetical protein
MKTAKTLTLVVALLTTAVTLQAQVKTTKLTVYKQFKPSEILLKDGRTLLQPLTNIFLKNSSLMYLRGTDAMEANMDNIVSVKFNDRLYVKIDTLLCHQVDTVGHDALYCATVIDQPAYIQQLKNNQVITNMALGDQISTATIDISTEEDYQFPRINIYYYRLNGKFVRVHERNLFRVLNKEQRRMLKTYMSLPDFSWSNEEMLKKILKALQKQ